MSKEKQVEEIAVIIEQAQKEAIKTPGRLKTHGNDWFGKWYATALYEAGCRMRSEGEWDESVPFCNKCSVCDAIVERYSVKNGHGRLNFCPNCGAKMGGGE